MHAKKIFMISTVILVAAIVTSAGCVANEPTAKTSDTVSVYYTLSVNGTELPLNVGSTPLEFTIGSWQVVAGFNDTVIGMKVGETKTVNIAPEDVYGAYSTEDKQMGPLSEVEEALWNTMEMVIIQYLSEQTMTFEIMLAEIK